MNTAASLLTLLSLTAAVRADQWPNWRGPNQDGSSGEKNLPVKFSPAEGTAWALDLPGAAASTPAVWDGHVFVTAAVKEEQKLYGYCVDAKTGTVKWKKQIGEGYQWDDRSNLASPSPVTDGQRVFFYFGTGDLAAYDFSGREVWKRNLQKDYGRFATQWTYSSSPMLSDGRLYIQVLQRNEAFEFGGQQKGEKDKPNDSYVVAFEPATGKELWKVIRPAEARAESLEAFSTPVVYKDANHHELLVVGGDCITGHDPKTGAERWRWATWNPEKISHWRLVPSAVAGDGIVLACAPKKAPVYAFKLGGKGVVQDQQIAWTSEGEKNVTSDVSTPLYYQGRFYILNSDRMSLACVEPKTGKVIWDERLEKDGFRPAKFESSPTGADGKIYAIDHRGNVAVAKAGDTFELLAINAMGSEQDQFIRSGIAAAGGHLYIRTANKLYCVGPK